ncbi:hypothetical protein KI387_015008, partial [Taxus chinensis]
GPQARALRVSPIYTGDEVVWFDSNHPDYIYTPYRRDSRETDLPILIPVDPLREAPPPIDDDDDVGVDEGYEAWYHMELPRHLLAATE